MPEVEKKKKEKNISRGRYVDGLPFDEITYLEANLILKPDQFSSVARRMFHNGKGCDHRPGDINHRGRHTADSPAVQN